MYIISQINSNRYHLKKQYGNIFKNLEIVLFKMTSWQFNNIVI